MHGTVVETFWAAIILAGGGWILWRGFRRSDGQGMLLFKMIATGALTAGEFIWGRSQSRQLHEGSPPDNAVTTFFLVGSVVVFGVIVAAIWTPQIGAFLFSPITNLLDGGNEKPAYQPAYSIAEARRKRGDIAGAVAEVQRQLAKFPQDFAGTLLLASLQAEGLKNLSAAEATLENFCARPSVTDNHVAAAWNTMADWQLKIANDAGAARAALEKIILRRPETELALLAGQRIAHLPGAGENEAALKDIAPGRLAAAHIRHLQKNPDDAAVREKLAVIYARDFRRLDLATEELRGLIDDARHSPRQVARWLNLLANFQVELGADVATVRGTLATIVARFPDLPVAAATRERLARIEQKLAAKNAGQNVRRSS